MEKKGQVWVETMIYTLIFLVITFTAIGIAKPKLEQTRDKMIIEQTISMLEEIDNTILSIIQGGTGNKRVLSVNLQKGEMKIDSKQDKIIFEIHSLYEFSEKNTEINIGRINAKTEQSDKEADLNKITLEKKYSNYNITFNNKEQVKKITKSPNPYKVYISNKGGETPQINFEII